MPHFYQKLFIDHRLVDVDWVLHWDLDWHLHSFLYLNRTIYVNRSVDVDRLLNDSRHWNLHCSDHFLLDLPHDLHRHFLLYLDVLWHLDDLLNDAFGARDKFGNFHNYFHWFLHNHLSDDFFWNSGLESFYLIFSFL